jgi:hypothetical protein
MLIKWYEAYPKQLAHPIQSYNEYLMLDWQITSHHPLDTLGTSIRYCAANLYNTYTMYHPPDVRWHILNDTMSQYYLHYYWILGLNGVNATGWLQRASYLSTSNDMDIPWSYQIVCTSISWQCIHIFWYNRQTQRTPFISVQGPL